MDRRSWDTPSTGRSRSRSLDVVVWEADGTVDGRHGYGAALAAALGSAGWRVGVVPLPRRAPTVLELAAPVHVLSGGSTSVTAAAAWLDATRCTLDSVLDRALGGTASVIGICFGAQLLASRLAGRSAVGPHPAGMQAGLAEVAGPDGGAAHVVSSFHYHHIDRGALEAVGASVTLTSVATPVQAFELGPTVRGVQFHPELAPDAFGAALRRNRTVVERHGATIGEAIASVDARRARWDDAAMRSHVVDPARRQLPGMPTAEAA